jgi:N-acetylmuramoyl-L-alanine amidase
MFMNNFIEKDLISFKSGSNAPIGLSTQRQKVDLPPVAHRNLDAFQYEPFIHDSQIPLKTVFGLKVKKIIIDPGHGGEDPGASGKSGTMEKTITLDIAKRLKSRLEKHKKYKVLMTRSRDVTVSLEERIEFANKHQGDLFISIHVNYIPSKPINIIETYYFGMPKNRQAIQLAVKENQSSQYSHTDFEEIIKNIQNTIKTQESNVLASAIQQSLFRNIRKQYKETMDYGIKSAPFIVLLGVQVPSVLTEISCLSNVEEEKRLNREGHREEIAQYLEEGIILYLNDKNNNEGEVKYANKRTPSKTG